MRIILRWFGRFSDSRARGSNRVPAHFYRFVNLLRGNIGRSRRSIAIILAVVGAFGLVVLLIGCAAYAGCICVHNQAHSVDNRPPMLRTEANPNDVAVGALMTVQVPEGLGPGSVFPVDVPGRGACRVTVPPGVFAGQTLSLIHI